MKKQLFLRLACFSAFILLSLFSVQEVKAETINNVCSSINQACSTNNRFTYSLYGSPEDTYATGTFKTSYSGRADYMVFDFDYDLLKDTTYSLSITANSTDFRNISKVNAYLEYASDCATTTGNIEITNLSFSKSKIVITFKTTQTSPRFSLTFGDPEGPAITGVSTFGVSSVDITTIESNDTQNIIDNNNQNANAIIDNQQQNTQDIIDNQNKNNEELKDTINNNFNSCRPSANLFPGWVIGTGINSTTGAIVTNDSGATSSDYIKVDFNSNSHYTLTGLTTNLRTFIASYNSNKEFLGRTGANYSNLVTIDSTSFASGTAQGTGDIAYIRITSYNPREGDITQVNSLKTMLNVGSTALDYEEYGKEICTNKLDEQVQTSKGILGTLKSVFTSIVELPKKIVDLLVDGLKSLFVPDSEELNQLMDDFKATISEKLGVIYQAGDLIISIFQNIIDDNSVENACLTFPELKVPNVEQPIIEKTDFCFNTITDEIPILLTTIRGISGVFITIMFVNMLKKKYDDFINGGAL